MTQPLQLRPPRHQVDRRSITLWTIQAAIGWLVLLGGLLITMTVFAANEEAIPAWLWITFLAVLALAIAHTVAMPRFRYRVHRWEVTDQAVYTLEGWLSRQWRIAPISRIQTVDTARGPLQQLLGLSSVTVTTASAAGSLSIDGLAHTQASALAEQLTAVTHATPGDAT